MYIPAIGKFSPVTVPEVFAKVTRPSLTLVSKVVTGIKGTTGFIFFEGGRGGWGDRDLIFPFILFKKYSLCTDTSLPPENFN